MIFRRWILLLLAVTFLCSTAYAAESEPEISADAFDELNDSEKEALLQELDENYSLEDLEKLDADALEAVNQEVIEPEFSLAYDENSGNYVYTFPDGSRLEMNVPDGAVTTRSVQLSLPDSCSVIRVSRDGEALYDTDKTRFSDNGSYELKLCKQAVTSDDIESLENADSTEDDMYVFLLHFQICDSLNNQLEVVNAPKNFEITAVSRNGKRSAMQESSYFFPGDGNYSIEFTSQKNDAVHYELRFTLDETPPVLSFSKDISGGRVKAPLEVSSKEACSVEVMHGAENFMLSQDDRQKISDSLGGGGSYHLTASDNAGNSRDYVFLMERQNNYGMLGFSIGGLLLFMGITLAVFGRKTLLSFIR